MRETLAIAPQSLKHSCPVNGSFMHPTKQAAQAALEQHKRAAKETGEEGKAWKRLNIYFHADCRHWHVGHRWERTDKFRQPKEQRPPTPGQLRRAAAKEIKEARRHLQRAA